MGSERVTAIRIETADRLAYNVVAEAAYLQVAAFSFVLSISPLAQNATLDEKAGAGRNYAVAEFRAR